MAKARVDSLLVEQGLAETRSKAQALVLAGIVFWGERKLESSGASIAADAELTVRGHEHGYVSRGGVKLAGALDAFVVSPNALRCLDMGASTGGFTDCLLQAGALRVYAIDVGTAQLDSRLKKDPRVVSREQTHAKLLRPEWFSPRPSLAVMDVSFISSAQVLPFVIPCLAVPFQMIVLVKPQFEVGPKRAPQGVVRDPAVRLQAVDKIRAAARDLGLVEAGLLESPVIGPKGNHEFLLLLKSKA